MRALKPMLFLSALLTAVPAIAQDSGATESHGFPFGIIGLLGLIGLFGARKVKG